LTTRSAIIFTITNSLGHPPYAAHPYLDLLFNNYFSAKPRLLVPPKYFMGLEVEAGHSIELRIPYKAYPPVNSTWTALSFEEERQLSSGGRYALQTDEKIIQLRISDCTRADAGEYRIFANNSVGSDSAIIKLVVLDKPEPPVRFLI